MEWYVGSGVNDIAVPKDEVSESWIQKSSKTFGSPNKYYLNERKCLCEEVHFPMDSLFNDTDMEFSSASSMCGGLEDASLFWSGLSYDPRDYELDNLDEIDPTQDIFFNSSIEENVNGKGLHGWFSVSPESKSGGFQTENLVSDSMLDSDDGSTNFYGMGSSKRLKTLPFSPVIDEEIGEWNSQFSSCNSGEIEGFPLLKAPVVEQLVPVAQYRANDHVGDRGSLEELVLNEIEEVMEQMTQKTRICFRDAFYRLANNSKQGNIGSQSQNGDVTVVGETWRSGRGKPTEAETNAIDRVVASLLFHKTGIEAQDYATSISLDDAQVPICGIHNTGRNAGMHMFSQEMVQ